MKTKEKRNTKAKGARAAAGTPGDAEMSSSGTVETTSRSRNVGPYERVRCEIGVDELRPSQWNPRHEITPESVADLTASIMALGVIQPLVAMRDEQGGQVLIAGHRRLVAAKAAGLETVPCDILVGIDAETARRMTFIENLQRKDADPLLESTLVGNLIADGMSQAEIAAETGRGEKWVARRLNLSKLSPSWRKRIESGEKITTDCIEHIAAYPAAIQERLKKARGYNCADGVLHWSDIRREFVNESCDLKEAMFDCSRCYKCAKNSGCAPSLFDFDGGKNQALGRCLDAKCYKRRADDVIKNRIADAKKDGATVIESDHHPGYGIDLKNKRDAKHSTLYVWTDWEEKKHTAWGAAPKEKGTGDRTGGMTEAEKEERRKKTARNKAIRKLAAWCEGNLAGAIRARGNVTVTVALVYQDVFGIGHNSWRLVGSDTGRSDAAWTVLAFHYDKAPDNWSRIAAAEITKTLGKEFYKDKNAPRILALFAESRAALTEEERRLIVSDEEMDELMDPKPVAWYDDRADDVA